jgi:hypothetical protein
MTMQEGPTRGHANSDVLSRPRWNTFECYPVSYSHISYGFWEEAVRDA